MANLNPIELMQLVKQAGPQNAVMQIIQQNYPNDPVAINFVQMAQRGDVQGVQKLAQTILNSQGKDFNTEITKLMGMFRGM